MKITFIAPFFHPVEGGMEKHVLYLSKELIGLGNTVEVFTSDIDRNKKIAVKEEVHNKIKIKRINTIFRIGDFGSFFPGVFSLIKNSNSDIIHFHSYRHPHNLGVFFTKKPKVITPHWPNYPRGLRSKWLDIAVNTYDFIFGNFILKKFDKIIAVCEPEAEWLKTKFKIKDNKISIIPNGIPKEQLKLRNGNLFRKEYGIRPDELVVLCFSRIHKSKGIDQVINVSKYFPQVKFIIMGNGSELTNLKNMAKNCSNVRFVNGTISDEYKMQAFAAADIFISPSHYEAFGITILEAFSQGCAVIASNTGGLPWVVGEAGLIFEDNNLEDLKNKILILVNDKSLIKKYSSLGIKRVKELTWDKIAKKLEKVYLTL